MSPRTLSAAIALLVASAPFPSWGEAPNATSPSVSPSAARSPETARASEVPKIRVRAGEHKGHSRIVFDWTRVVGYRLDQAGDTVTIRFDKPGRADLSSARRVGASRVKEIVEVPGGEGLTVRLTTVPGTRLRHFTSGTRVVVDVIGDGADKTAGKAKEDIKSAKGATTPGPDEGPPLHELRGSRTQSAESGTTPSATKNPSGKTVPATPSEPAGSAAPDTQSGMAAKNAGPSGKAAVPSSSSQPPPSQAATATGQSPVVPGAKAGASSVESGAASAEAVKPVSLVFDTRKPAAAAIFERAGWLYVLFDRELPPGVMPVASELSGPVERFSHSHGTGFRLVPPPLLSPKVMRDGTVWRVILTSTEEGGPEALTVDPEPDFALGPRLVVKAADAAAVIDFHDPVVGDDLKVVPLPAPGARIAVPLRYAEAQLLATAQGVVVRPIKDELLVQPVREGIEITAAGGLSLSPPEDLAISEPPPPPVVEPQRLFDFDRWGRSHPGDLTANRQRLWQALIALPEEERTRGRLDLARFYAANGLGHEALGMLDRVLEQQPDLDRRAEFLAVRGVARQMAGNSAGALADLSDQRLAGEADADLWSAAAAAGTGDWARAHELFTSRQDHLRGYPEPFFTPLMLRAAEAALRAGDPDAAGHLLDRLGKRGAGEGARAAAYQYLRGAVHRQLGDSEKAERAWEKVVASTDRLYRTRARKDLIDLRLSMGKLTPKQAADEMEKMRFAWRGDEVELGILRRLGELHAQAGNYPQAFDTMRRTVSLFPDGPDAAEITRQMTDTFANLFKKDGAAHLPAIEALSLYEQYRELTPAGPDGDMIIRRLAERLVEMDLLDRAGELLDHQMRYRLTGLEKARIGTRLAGIRLLDGKAEPALTALDASEEAGIPADLAAERRLLRAHALSRMGRGAEAVQLLAADQSRTANMLRIDIAWRSRQWGAAAQALADVIGPPPAKGAALEGETARLVVNRAVALAMAQDTAGLSRLRQEFGSAMEATREANAFRVLTRPNEVTGLVDNATLRSRMAEVDLFRNFLESYRTRQEQVPGADGGTAAPANNAVPEASSPQGGVQQDTAAPKA